MMLKKVMASIRLAEVFLDAVLLNKDLKKISASRIEKLKMKFKKQFNAAAFYPELLEKGQFIFYGDTNHSDTSIHIFFYSKENIEAMSKAGIRHIFPEIEPQYQDLVDDVASGKSSDEDFARALLSRVLKAKNENINTFLQTPGGQEGFENIRARGRGFAMMQQHGMQIHCVDDRSNLDREDLEQLEEFMKDVRAYIIKNTGLPAIIHGKIMIRFVIDNLSKIGKNVKNYNMKNLMKGRMADDPALAKRMLALAGDEKAAILFGAGHASLKNGLYDCLGRDRTVRIDIHSSIDMYADRMMISARGGDFSPDFVHIMDRGKIYKMG